MLRSAIRRLPTRFYSRLTAEQRATLAQMKRDNSLSAPPFTPSPILWRWLSGTVEKQLHLDGISPESSIVNHWFSAHLPGHKKYYF